MPRSSSRTTHTPDSGNDPARPEGAMSAKPVIRLSLAVSEMNGQWEPFIPKPASAPEICGGSRPLGGYVGCMRVCGCLASPVQLPLSLLTACGGIWRYGGKKQSSAHTLCQPLLSHKGLSVSRGGGALLNHCFCMEQDMAPVNAPEMKCTSECVCHVMAECRVHVPYIQSEDCVKCVVCARTTAEQQCSHPRPTAQT